MKSSLHTSSPLPSGSLYTYTILSIWLLCFMLQTSLAQVQDYTYQYMPIDKYLKSTNDGLLYGSRDQTLYYTTDYGKTRQVIETPVFAVQLFDYQMFSEQEALIFHESGLCDSANTTTGRNIQLHRTNDGGQTWSNVSLQPWLPENSIYLSGSINFITPLEGVVQISIEPHSTEDTTNGTSEEVENLFLRTDDGGQTWTTIKLFNTEITGDTLLWSHLNTYNSGRGVVGFVMANYPEQNVLTVAASFDGGETWSMTAFDSTNHVPTFKRRYYQQLQLDTNQHLHFHHRHATDSSQRVHHFSSDSGVTWQTQFYVLGDSTTPDRPTNTSLAASIIVIDSSNILLHSREELFRTDDGGQTWEEVYNLNDFPENIIQHRRGYHAHGVLHVLDSVIIGGNTIIHSRDGGRTWSIEEFPTDVYAGGDDYPVHPLSATSYVFCSYQGVLTRVEQFGGKYYELAVAVERTYLPNAYPTKFPHGRFAMVNDTVGYFLANENNLFRTNDNWQTAETIVIDTTLVSRPESNGLVRGYGVFYNLAFIDEQQGVASFLWGGYVGARNGSLMIRTDDGGATWDTVMSDTNRSIFNIVHDGSTLYALVEDIVNSGFSSVFSVIESVDGGKTWSAGKAVPEAAKTATLRCDTTTGALYLLQLEFGRPLLLRSDTRGESWDTIYRNPQLPYSLPPIDDLLFLHQQTGTVGIPIPDLFIVSKDEGKTWQFLELNSSQACRDKTQDANFGILLQNYVPLNDSVGFASVGRFGGATSRIQLHYSPISSVEAEPTPTLGRTSVWIWYVRPTPLVNDAEIKISWLASLPASAVTLEVYDMEGNVVADLSQQVVERQNGNVAECTFDASTLSSGTYVVVAKANGFVHTKKTIKIE